MILIWSSKNPLSKVFPLRVNRLWSAAGKSLMCLDPNYSTDPCRGVEWALHRPHISRRRNSPDTPLRFSSLIVTLPTRCKWTDATSMINLYFTESEAECHKITLLPKKNILYMNILHSNHICSCTLVKPNILQRKGIIASLFAPRLNGIPPVRQCLLYNNFSRYLLIDIKIVHVFHKF